MKKLMIALTVGVVAVYANAATVEWSATTGCLYDGRGDASSKITSGTAYLVNAMYLQSELVSEFVYAGGKAAATLAVLQMRAEYLREGDIDANATIYGSVSTLDADLLSAYFVIFNGDNMYISESASTNLVDFVEFPDGALEKIYEIVFSDDLTTSSKALPLDATKGYSSAGWYAVPEPTSGLLLLIGMAGLALKRKRA